MRFPMIPIVTSFIAINVLTATQVYAQVERITVTGARSEQLLSTESAAISVIDESVLNIINAQHINQVLSFAPSTWISRGNGQEHLTAIRSPVLTGAGSCAAFYMALDGISLRAPGFCNANQLFDVNSEQAERIEVLRGPASALYGSNALHGVINVIAADALNNTNTVSATAGAYEYYRGTLDQQLLNADTKVRILGNITQEGGFQADSGFDQQKVTLITSTRINDWDNKTVIDASNLNQETAGFVQGFQVYKNDILRRQNPNPEAFRDTKSILAYSAFSRDSLKVTPYFRWNQMRFLQHYLPWQALEENGHRSVGIQIQKNMQYLGADVLTGIDVDLTSGWLKETQADPFSPNIPEGQHYDYEVDAQQFGGFLMATWTAHTWQFKLGARAEYIDYDYDNNLSDGNACAPNVQVCRFTRPGDQSVNFSHLSSNAELAYIVDENQRLYVKYSQGFRAPQTTELFRLQNNQQTTNISEVSMDSIEAGWRLNLDGNSLSANLYHMQKQDVIVQDTNRQVVGNGETSHRGIEVEWRWAITEKLNLQTALTYQKHEYDSDLAISQQSLDGNIIDTSPEKLAAVLLSYEITSDISSSISIQYMDDYFLDPENSASYDGHQLVDLNVKWQISPALELQANLYNLLDEDYAERADFAFGNYRYFVGQPRRLFVRLSLRY